MFVRTTLLVLRKDFAIERRSLEIFVTTLFYAVACVLVFSFGLVKEGRAPTDVAAAILWIAIAFAGTLALGRTFERERYGETIRALLAAPAPRPALYVGKLLGVVFLLAVAEAILVPLIGVLFAAPFFAKPLAFVALLAAGTIGFATVGTLFAAMLMRTRSRDVLLPILLYPITIPVIICGVRGTAALLATPADEPMAIMWLGILVAMDTVFMTIALWTFETLMID